MDKKIQGCYYNGYKASPYLNEVCEHVHLNKMIREKGGKIFINTEMLNNF